MRFSKFRPLVVLLWLCLVCYAGSASAEKFLDQPVEIQESGRAKTFWFAADEVQFPAEPAPRYILPASNLRDLRGKAKLLSQSTGKKAALVLYPAGAARGKFSRRIVTSELLFWTKGNVDTADLGKQFNGAVASTAIPHAYLLRIQDPADALEIVQRLRAHPQVAAAELQLARLWQKKVVPNDPLFPQQWHLRNIGQNGGTGGIDLNLTNVWNTYRGSSIYIGIVDDGLQFTHPDLAANYNTALDYDFNFSDGDPSPHNADDSHGTAVAGVAAARGNNSRGVAGSAYEATLVGLQLISFPTTDSQDAAAMAHSNSVIHIKNNSWGAFDCDTLEGPGPLTAAALKKGALEDRNGRGVHYVWAAGNGGDCGENANYDGYANSIYVLSIAAVSDTGARASYSERGACLLASAPSSSDFRQGITTTDLTGDDGYNYTGAGGETSDIDYTQFFGGTSSAAPAAAGVVALILQSNPNLGYRDTKEIIMRSSTPLQVQPLIWRTNSAGIWHNHNLGAGLINVQAAIGIASNWMGLGAVTNITEERFLSRPIPDDDDTGISETFTFTNMNFRIEHVTLTMDAPHDFWGDLNVELVSPGGVESFLAESYSSVGSGYYNWTFSSLRHWGEKANGTWTVRVSDPVFADSGTLNYLKLAFHGTEPEAVLRAAKAETGIEIHLHSPAPGWTYAIDASDNFQDWQQVATLMIPPSGRVKHHEALGTRRFFRARLIP